MKNEIDTLGGAGKTQLTHVKHARWQGHSIIVTYHVTWQNSNVKEKRRINDSKGHEKLGVHRFRFFSTIIKTLEKTKHKIMDHKGIIYGPPCHISHD